MQLMGKERPTGQDPSMRLYRCMYSVYSLTSISRLWVRTSPTATGEDPSMRLTQESVQCVLPDLYLQLMGKDLPHSNRTGSLY